MANRLLQTNIDTPIQDQGSRKDVREVFLHGRFPRVWHDEALVVRNVFTYRSQLSIFPCVTIWVSKEVFTVSLAWVHRITLSQIPTNLLLASRVEHLQKSLAKSGRIDPEPKRQPHPYSVGDIWEITGVHGCSLMSGTASILEFQRTVFVLLSPNKFLGDGIVVSRQICIEQENERLPKPSRTLGWLNNSC